MLAEEKKPVIKVKNLNVTYFPGQANEVRALKDVNLEIYLGEFVIFFGPSGCGKSTLLYSIAGLETAAKGDILVNDKNIAQLTQKELEFYHQKATGMIFQAFYLINSLSVFENIILPQIAVNASPKERKQKAEKLLTHFGVKEQMYKLPNELSGGQQQRIAICRALINNPDILFADEPVGNLDSKSAEDVMILLKDLNVNQKKTIILVTHNPAHLDIAHRVFYVKDGAVIKTKVNKLIDESLPLKQGEDFKTTISKDLELLARSFSSITGSAGNLLIPFKAKQIVSEVLTNMTSEEIGKIEKKVESLLITGIEDDSSLFQFLDQEVEKGGLGMDKRIARSLTDQIKKIVKEIKLLQKEENEAMFKKEYNINEEAVEIRSYIFKTLSIDISDDDIVKKIDGFIKLRLENKIDKKTLFKKLDLPVKKGGIGLDKRDAKKISKLLELLILGKYR